QLGGCGSATDLHADPQLRFGIRLHGPVLLPPRRAAVLMRAISLLPTHRALDTRRSVWRLACAVVVIAGCEWNSSIPLDPDAAQRPDGQHVDAPVLAPAHPLLTEVALAPANGEFIEIVNPGNDEVDLSTYYLSDNGNYFSWPTGQTALGGNDF